MSVVLPAMSSGQAAGWRALLALHELVPGGWALVGGQMVHTFTAALRDLGFGPDGTSPAGHQHRWVRADAQIDVLIPRNLGEKAARRRGVGGGTTLETPGAQQALDRAVDVHVVVEGTAGTVRRPSLLGALAAKAAAHTVSLDQGKRRHRQDFAVLSTLVAPSDRVQDATKRDRRYIGR